MDTGIPTFPKTSSQALYEITVAGKLTENWADWFNGAAISLEYGQDGQAYTILTCQIRDQAELFGILNRLNSLNLTLLRVAFIRNKGGNHVK